jgi:hypothetical protein
VRKGDFEGVKLPKIDKISKNDPFGLKVKPTNLRVSNTLMTGARCFESLQKLTKQK